MSGNIPSELMTDIIARLPGKSLVKFRCVCKSWNSEISNPVFVSRQTKFTIEKEDDSLIIIGNSDWPKFMIYNDDDSIVDNKIIEMPLDINTMRSFFLVGLCCGLVCFTMTGLPPKDIYIGNPAVRSILKLPVKQFPSTFLEPILGFGYDQETNEYKVVRIVYPHPHVILTGEKPLSVDVFVLSVGMWKNVISKAFPSCYIKMRSPQAFVNGAVHWIGYHYVNNIAFSGETLVVAVFEIRDEIFKDFKIPEGMELDVLTNTATQELCVGVIRERLGLIHYFIQSEKSLSYDGFCIWVMNEYGVKESWTKQVRVDLKLGVGKVIGVRRNGEILLVTRYNYELVSFNPSTRKITKLGLFSWSSSFYMDTYVEVLALLDNATGISGEASSSNLTIRSRSFDTAPEENPYKKNKHSIDE